MAKLYTVSEAAAALGLTGAAIRLRISRGDMHAERYGERLLLIPAREVERAAAHGRLKSGPKVSRRRQKLLALLHPEKAAKNTEAGQ